MVVVALTGGIGSGKSTVSRMLSGLGAKVIDADEVARAVVVSGGETYSAILERFGEGIKSIDGEIDRSRLGEIVFNDDEALADLNQIVHPVTWERMSEMVGDEAGNADVVILDVPLLFESSTLVPSELHIDGLIAVDCPEDICVDRLVRARRMDAMDIRRRQLRQLERSERNRLADLVIDNSGSLEALSAKVGEAWRWINRLQQQT